MKPKLHGQRFVKLVQGVDVQEIDSKTLFEKMNAAHPKNNKLIVIDVREESEWLHDPKIKGAIHLSKGVIERDIEKTVPDSKASIVVYCSGGFRSRLAANALKKMGYSNVLSLKGGLRQYLEFQEKLNHQ